MIAITNPALWAGAAALVVPALIHLLTRRARRRVAFPSLRFLQRARASQSRLFKLRHWLLFALRTLLLAFLLLAFLKPVLRAREEARAPDREVPSVAIVVLDASASMGYQGMGGTLFTRGKVAARQTLDRLNPSDRANLVLAAARPGVSLREPSVHKHHLRADLDRAAVTAERADLDAALAEAVRQLQSAPDHRREIHLISDFQRSNWAAVNFAVLPRDVKTVFVPVADSDPRNVSIAEVMLEPPFPVSGEDVEIVCRLANRQPEAVEARIEVRVGDGAPLTRTVPVPANLTATASFRVRAEGHATLEGVARIPGDRQPADDARFFTLAVADRVRVLVVSDEPTGARAGTAGVLAAALDPFDGGRDSVFAVSRAGADDLPPLDPAVQHVVLVSGAGAFPERARAALLAYLKGGGSAVWFLATPRDAENLRDLAANGGGDVTLPFQPLAAREGPAALTEANFDHPIFRKFRDVASLSDIRFTRHFATERAKGHGLALARFDDGAVAVGAQSVGAGALLLANFSVSPSQGDIAKRALFVPLLHEMVKGVRPRRGRGENFLVGGSCSVTVGGLGGEKRPRFTSPSGLDLSPLLDVRRDETAVLFAETREAGFHRVYLGEARVGSVAVNVDPRESDTDGLTSEQLAAVAKRPTGAFFSTGEASAANAAAIREGRPVWYGCLVAVWALLALEQIAWLAWGPRRLRTASD
jgi:hypothetical protein